MVTEGSTGFSSRIGQQVILSRDTIDASQRANVLALTLEATNGGISLQGTALDLNSGQKSSLTFKEGEFITSIDGGSGHSTDSLFNQVENADMHVTLTAHPPVNTQTQTPQPGIWPDTAMHSQSNVIGYPQLTAEGTLTFRARHVYQNSQLLIDGEPVDAELECAEGALPNCIDERVQATLSLLPEQGLLPVTAAELARKIQQRSVFLFRCHGTRGPIERPLQADRPFRSMREQRRELGVC